MREHPEALYNPKQFLWRRLQTNLFGPQGSFLTKNVLLDVWSDGDVEILKDLHWVVVVKWFPIFIRWAPVISLDG